MAKRTVQSVIAKRKARKKARNRTRIEKRLEELAPEVDAVIGRLIRTLIRYYPNSIDRDSSVVTVCSLGYGSDGAGVLDELVELGIRGADKVFIPVYLGSMRLAKAYTLPRRRYSQLESGLIVPHRIAVMVSEKSRDYNRARVEGITFSMRNDTLYSEQVAHFP